LEILRIVREAPNEAPAERRDCGNWADTACCAETPPAPPTSASWSVDAACW
jgi:hypothetical protein